MAVAEGAAGGAVALGGAVGLGVLTAGGVLIRVGGGGVASGGGFAAAGTTVTVCRCKLKSSVLATSPVPAQMPHRIQVKRLKTMN